MSTFATPTSAPIGVFDSGIGGLSILRALRKELRSESFVYFADSAHAPYGEKGDAFVIARSLAITSRLVAEHSIKALVVACNTATAAAIAILRSQHPALPIIGVEPALKPALAVSRTKRIAVIGTRGTLTSAKFQALLASVATQAEFICHPCDGLAEAIEQHASFDNTTKIRALCDHMAATFGKFSLHTGEIDTLVLGCTHYPLVADLIAQSVGAQVQILEPGEAVARRLREVLDGTDQLAHNEPIGNRITLETSGAQSPIMQASARWL